MNFDIHYTTLQGLNFTNPVENVYTIEKKISQISSIKTLKDLPTHHLPAKTLVLLDHDDTSVDFPFQLGSGAWRKYIAAETKKIDPTLKWHDKLSLYLTKNYPVQAVETITSSFIKNLQDQGCVVSGLTARERNKWYSTTYEGVDELTINQLISVGINYDNQSLEKIYPYLIQENSEYYKGTFFVDTDTKGEYLLKLFANVPKEELPKKVVFIDDKMSQVESVKKALDQLGIENDCYCYTATEAKTKAFDPLIANIQLYYFFQSNGKEIITDEQAAEIAKSNPENADYYLKATMEIARKF